MTLVALFLVGCGTVPSDFIVVCPPIPNYSESFQSQLAKELETLPDSSVLHVVIHDYLALRDKLRECRLENDDDAFRGLEHYIGTNTSNDTAVGRK